MSVSTGSVQSSGKRFFVCDSLLLSLAGLVDYAAGGFAGGLATGLAFAAAAGAQGVFQVAGFKGLDTRHIVLL